MGYLHGVEILQKLGTAVLRESETAIVGLVGIAEKGRTGEVVLITNLAQATAEFGRDLEGTTIMSAIKSIYADGTSPLLVVNVANGAKLTAMIDATTGKVKTTASGDLVTQIHADTLAQTAGLVNFQAELISGLELLKAAQSTLGMRPNFIIAPGFSQVLNIANKMRDIAEYCKGKAVIDIYGASVQDALTKRNSTYAISDTRVIFCFPNCISYNEDEQKNVIVPLSQLWVNEMVGTHAEDGYWHSNSGRELKSVLSTAVTIISSLTDSGADSNLLNAQGIVTVYRDGKSGFVLWGNWTSAFPTISGHAAQIAPSIVKDVIEETIQTASFGFVNKNIDYATLDYIVGSVQQFFYGMKAKGAIIDGSIGYTQDKNPIAQVSTGQFVFDYSYCEVPTLDRITYESYQDLNYLNELFK